MSQTTHPVRRRRADAQRNYDRLLTVARKAVDEGGRDVSLEEVAREAGVAIGTLYNHFPTRRDLLEAVFLGDTRDLKALAEALATEPEPLAALTSWLRLQMTFSTRSRSIGPAVLSAKHVEGSELHSANLEMQEAGALLLRRAQAAGEVRPAISILEVLRLVYGIGMANDHAADPERAEKMFDIVIAGIQTAPPTT